MANSEPDKPDETPKQTSLPVSPKHAVGNLEKDVYAAAAECIDAVMKRRASVKSAIFNSPFQDKRFLMAMTQKTMDNLQHVRKIVYDAQLLKKEPRLTKSMAYVITYDMVFGDMRAAKGVARLADKFKEELKEAAAKYAKTKKVDDVRSIKPVGGGSGIIHTPRYVRVNTLRTTTDEVIETLKKDGFSLHEYDNKTISQKTFIKMLGKFTPKTFFRDYHVPDLLVFHPTVIFHEHHLEKSGSIVLQDKASCLASLLLNPPKDSTVIDACAAPGMKTSHLAALMHNQGQIYAIDINETRCETMKSLLSHNGVKCATVLNTDFAQTDPLSEDYKSVTHILVDPTCTGSGVTARNQLSNKKKQRTTKEDRQRLQKLRGLQAKLLKHALSFPSVERVVYSTCSINPEEDEEVVQDAMKGFMASFTVRPFSNYLPTWKGCGKPRYSVGPNCLRAFTEKHRTNGFFVAVIERIGSNGEEATVPPNAEDAKVPLDDVTQKSDESISTPGSSGKKRKRKPGRYTERWTIEMEKPDQEQEKEYPWWDKKKRRNTDVKAKTE